MNMCRDNVINEKEMMNTMRVRRKKRNECTCVDWLCAQTESECCCASRAKGKKKRGKKIW